jgi:ribosomal protein S18 acetylase RimI-like enzyme
VDLRNARLDELEEVAGVMVAAYRQYAPLMPSDYWEQYVRNIADVRSRLDTAELIVAEEEGRVLGAVTFYPDGSRSREGWPEGYSSIRLLAAHPAARGLGLGRILTEECVRRSRLLGVRYVGLHTTGFMAVAKSMYERMGFQRVPEYDVIPIPDLVVLAYRLELM